MFHLHVRYCSRDGGGSSAAACRYISRLARYKKCPDRVRWVKSLHMPTWAGTESAEAYWIAAEGRHSRENARSAILIVIALPKGLTNEQQDELAIAYADLVASMVSKDKRILGKLPVTVALHEGFGRNPHLHVLLSTSVADGIERDAQSWFHRYNPNRPQTGGARRSKFITERGWLFWVRQAWARLANQMLESCGLEATLDHRSHATRGLATAPQLHLGPAVAHMRKLGIETSRGKRFDAIQKDELERKEQEAAIARRRQVVHNLEIEAMALDRAQREWLRERGRQLQQLLGTHPLAGGRAELVRAATAFVVDGDAPARATDDLLPATVWMVNFAHAIGQSWIPIAGQRFCWAVKPHQEEVVVLGSDYAATDAGDEESFKVMIRIAGLLPLGRPKLVVQDRLRALCTELLERLGLEWQLEVSGPKTPRRDLMAR